ncbi:hypothetical protein QR680_012944 [Steinernema hermaphroditum]|uniref:Uncharacterized protein n=1 Tax=Steinernema hermaphroditum TaxID=289476 RepID=A0AA39I6N4_9BILA|nr:hypothetical protein QR680_012944 [Steinernema hermaphroditum]
MAFANNYYNYQVGVIFAILVGALILLALFVLAMYFVVKSMRHSAKPTYTPSRSASSTRPMWQAQVEPAPIQYSNLENPPTSPFQPQSPLQPQFSQPSPAVQPGYLQQPLVQTYPNEPLVTHGGQVRSLQPEMTYQQGPTSWSIVTPVHEQHHLEQPTVPAHQSFPTSSV